MGNITAAEKVGLVVISIVAGPFILVNRAIQSVIQSFYPSQSVPVPADNSETDLNRAVGIR